MKLVYHKNADNSPYSPFDSEIVSMAEGQDLFLVSPYIGLPYLKRLIKISKSWKLLTDFQEWIISHPSKSKRLEICDFISENFKNIKHIADIHAKVLITNNSAFLGSANFTEKGIQIRTEMSISFSETEKVQELKDWFNLLWANANGFSEKQLADFVEQNANTIAQPQIVSLKGSFEKQKRKAALVPIDTLLKTGTGSEQELIKALITIGKNNKWFNKYFDLVKDVLTEFDIDENSPKIAMSVTKESRIAISIGQRYVIHPMANVIGFILPLEFIDIISDYPNLTGTAYFKNKKGEEEAFWGEFDGDIIFAEDTFLLKNWKNAIKTELNRTTTSSYRKYHNPFYYKAVMDLNYRRDILNIVY